MTKTALVTGASSGIGQAVARQLAEQGWNLVVIARRSQRLEQLATALRTDFGVQITPLVMDLAEIALLSSSLRQGLAGIEGLDAVVLAAGHGRGYGALRSHPDREAMRSELQVNLLAPIELCAELLPLLDRTSGTAVLIGSVFDQLSAAEYSSYAAAKAGLLNFARSVRKERAPGAGARICVISPGTVRTEFPSVLAGRDAQTYDADRYPFVPLEADDVARAALWAINAPAHVELRELLIQATGEQL